MFDKRKKNGNMNHSWWISSVLLLLSLTFIFDLWGGDLKRIKENLPVDPEYFSNDNVRTPFNAPRAKQAGFTYNCNSCHQNIEPPKVQRKLIAAHQNIKLEHGVITRCYSCHHPIERELLIDVSGSEIAFSKSELLCQKCHGPKFRDWKIGIHGRQSAYWDKTKGESKKVTCVACHDPHSPKFKPMKPAPGPIRHNYLTDAEKVHE